MQYPTAEERKADERECLIDANKQIANLLDKLAEYEAPMSCGHSGRYMVGGKDNTQYCLMCVVEAMREADGE